MAEAKKNSKPKTKAKKKQDEAVENRLKEQMEAEVKAKEVKVLGQIDKTELEELKSVVRQVQDNKRVGIALANHFDRMMTQIKKKYGLPENATIDEDTGVARGTING